MSYFKYAERSSESRVDWNEISKGMVDMLKEQTRLRNEKLDEAVKLQGEVTTKLSEAPMGSDVNANERVSQFAADAQEYSLMMNKLWRSGEMSYREYMAATNNFKTNAEGYLSQAEKYAANYEKHVERMKADENGYAPASGVEVAELARVEDFGNFSKFTPVIDAPTGSIGLVGEDGRQYASVSQLGVAVMATYDRLDVAGLAAQAVDSLGDVIRPFREQGIESLESVLTPRDEDGNPIGELTEYEKAEDEIVNGILDTDDNAATSVLVDYTNLGYDTIHLDSQEAIEAAANDPKMVVMMPSPRNKDRAIGAVEDDVTDAQFDAYLEQAQVPEELRQKLRDNRKAQKDKAFDAVRNRIRTGLPFKVEATAVPTPTRLTEEEQGRLIKQQERTIALDNWDILGTSNNPEEVDDARAAIIGSSVAQERAKELGYDRLEDIVVRDNVVLLLYRKGDELKTVEVSRQAGEPGAEGTRGPIGRNNWLRRGTYIHGIDNRNVIDQYTSIEMPEGEERTVQTDTTPPARRTPEQPVEPWSQGTVTITVTDEKTNVPVATPVPLETAWKRTGGDAVAQTDLVKQIVNDRIQGQGEQVTHFTGNTIRDIVEDKYPEYDNLGGLAVTRFYIPQLTEKAIYIPMTDEGKAVLKEITQAALERKQSGDIFTAADLDKYISRSGLDAQSRRALQEMMSREFPAEETAPVVSQNRSNPAPG